MSLTHRLIAAFDRIAPAPVADAHCDGPCGVYDPASARIAAEATLSMAKKLNDLGPGGDLAAENTKSRYIAIKEEQAELAKHELLILWTDYFKPNHLEDNPDLHTIFWNAAKQCSLVKTTADVSAAEDLLSQVENIHNIFWASKGRDVPWYTAS